YESAYLKCHHPAAFLTAMLNCFPLGFYHPATLVKDAQRHSVTVRAIDVAHSDWKCTIETDAPNLSYQFFGAESTRESATHPLRGDDQIPPPDQGEVRWGLSALDNFGAKNQGPGADSLAVVRLGLKYVNGLREETGLRAGSERRR